MTRSCRWSARVSMALVLAAGMGAAAEAQSSRELTMRLSDGIVLAVSMDGVEGDAQTPDFDVRSSTGSGEVHRLVVDEKGVARFAYAVSVEPDGDGAALSFRPVRLHETLGAFSPGTPTYTLSFGLDGSIATLGERQTTGRVSEGDVIRLDVFEQPQTGQRLTDVIRVVELSPSSVRRLAASRAVRSATPPTPTLTLAWFELTRDGETLTRTGGLATGHTLMLGLAGRGTSLWMYVVDRDVPDPSMRDFFKGPVWVGASGSVEGALTMFRPRPATP